MNEHAQNLAQRAAGAAAKASRLRDQAEALEAKGKHTAALSALSDAEKKDQEAGFFRGRLRATGD